MQGPPACGHVPTLTIPTPIYEQIDKGVNPHRKSNPNTNTAIIPSAPVADAKRSASHSFGLRQGGREGDSDDRATQDHHTHRPGLRRPGEGTLVPLFSGSTTREAAQHGRQHNTGGSTTREAAQHGRQHNTGGSSYEYKSNSLGVENGRYGLPPTVGGIIVSQWSATARL